MTIITTGLTVAGLGLRTHSTSEGSIALTPGDLVASPTGAVYRYIGTAGTVDLGSAQFAADTADWAAVAVGDISLTAGEAATINAERTGASRWRSLAGRRRSASRSPGRTR